MGLALQRSITAEFLSVSTGSPRPTIILSQGWALAYIFPMRSSEPMRGRSGSKARRGKAPRFSFRSRLPRMSRRKVDYFFVKLQFSKRPLLWPLTSSFEYLIALENVHFCSHVSNDIHM